MALSLIAERRYRNAVSIVFGDLFTGDTVREAATQAKQHFGDAPILVLTSESYAVPSPVRDALRRNAESEGFRLAHFAAEDFPVRVSHLADSLDLEVDDAHLEATLNEDGSLSLPPSQASDTDELDELLASLDAAGTESVPAGLAGGWGIADLDDETNNASLEPALEPVEYETLSDDLFNDNEGLDSEPLPFQLPEPVGAVTPAPAPPPAAPDEAAALRAELAALRAQLQAPPAPPVDAEDPFMRSDMRQAASRRGVPAEVIAVWAGGGGNAKTTTSCLLAQRAGEAGLRALLLDGTRGQPDITHIVMRVLKASQWGRTISAAEASGEPRDAIVTAKEANEFRRQRPGNTGEPIAFDSIFAPHGGEHDSSTIGRFSARLYLNVVERLRSEYDLIVIDTQTLDNDGSDLFDDFVFPLFNRGIWNLAVSGTERTKQRHMSAQMEKMQAAGIPMSRSLALFTKMEAWDSHDTESAAHTLPWARVIGATIRDPRFERDFDEWRIDTRNPAVSERIREVLSIVFPDEEAFAETGDEERTGGFMSTIRKWVRR